MTTKKFVRPALLAALCLTLPGIPAMAASPDPLAFPAGRFTLETRTVKSGGVGHTVQYRVYRHLPYVAKPVDKAYQSLDVSVPVKIDGKPVSAAGAPIVLDIRVGGYMSVNNANPDAHPMGAMPGMPPHGAMPPGGPGMAGMPPGGPGAGDMPPPPPTGAGAPPASAGQGGHAGVRPLMGGNGDKVGLALAAGYVVVTPGVRGWDNKARDGSYYGKAPAAIVDLKAAVRYIRHNAGRLPGNPDWIVSSGCSAGGALSALVGASGNSPLFEPYLKAIGAANAPDNIFASACFSPITDLDHADVSYEWMFGKVPGRSGLVDQTQSAALAAANGAYQDSLGLTGRSGFGAVTGERLGDYVLQAYAEPSATKYLAGLDDTARAAYLARNPWIKWDGKAATFGFADYAAHITRMKGLPAFDDFKLTAPENKLFGDSGTEANHFTAYSLREATGKADAQLDPKLQELVYMMNAMNFTANPGAAPHWWLRNGSSDNNNSQSVMINLATALENHGRDVSALLFWDGGHCADDDPEGMVAWISQITGYTVKH